MKRKRAKISVLLNSDEFDRFESHCQERGFKKSILIARLIRDHLDEIVFDCQAKTLPEQERTTWHRSPLT